MSLKIGMNFTSIQWRQFQLKIVHTHTIHANRLAIEDQNHYSYSKFLPLFEYLPLKRIYYTGVIIKAKGNQMNANKILHLSANYIQNLTRSLCTKIINDQECYLLILLTPSIISLMYIHSAKK